MSTGKILVVDDDANLLELVRIRLEAAKYEVVTAVKGEEAKAALTGDNIDLSIVDLKLADQDGMSLMGELHAINPALPVIILTGYGSIEGAVEAIKRGAYGVSHQAHRSPGAAITDCPSLGKSPARQRERAAQGAPQGEV